METKQTTKKKITFPKILGVVVIAWLAIALVKPLFANKPKAVTGFGGDIDMESVQEVVPNGVQKTLGATNLGAPSVGRTAMDEAVVPEPMMTKEAPVETINVEKRIIKNGNLRLKVESTEKSVEEIKDIAKQFKGDVYNVNIYQSGKNGLQGNVVVKVPVAEFENAFDAIKKIGDQVLSQSVSSSDVTEEYIDLQAQIRNKKAEEETFRRLLEQSGRLEDVLKVTREVARVRGEIDRLEGRIKYMESQTDMATINVTLVEYEQLTSGQNTWKPLRVAQKALHDLVIKSQGLINGLIYLVIVQLPLLIIISLVSYVLYKIIVKIFKKFRK